MALRCASLPPQLPEGYGGSGSHVERIHAARHGYAHHVVAALQHLLCQAVAFGAHHYGEALLAGKAPVVYCHRLVAQRHGCHGKAHGMQPFYALCGPGRYVGPWQLKDRPHAHAYRTPVEGVAAGGAEQGGVYAQRGGSTEDGTRVGGVDHVVQHHDAACCTAHLLYAAPSRTTHGAQHAARQLVARQLSQEGAFAGIYRYVAAARYQFACLPLHVALLRQHRYGLVARLQCRAYHLGDLGNEDAFLLLQPVAQLRLREAAEDVELRTVQVRDVDDVSHDASLRLRWWLRQFRQVGLYQAVVAQQGVVDDAYIAYRKAFDYDVVQAAAWCCSGGEGVEVAHVAVVGHGIACRAEGVILRRAPRVPVGTHDDVAVVAEGVYYLFYLLGAVGGSVFPLVPVQMRGDHLHRVAVQQHRADEVVALLHHLGKHHRVGAHHAQAVAEDGVAVVAVFGPYLGVRVVVEDCRARLYSLFLLRGVDHQRVVLHQCQQVGSEVVEEGAIRLLVELQRQMRQLRVARLPQREMPYVPAGYGDFGEMVLLCAHCQCHQQGGEKH